MLNNRSLFFANFAKKIMNEQINQYIATHIDPEPRYLYQIWRETNVTQLNGRMASGHIQGRILSLFSNIINPTLAIEIGTFTGYSALCIAEGLQDSGILHTFEIDDELEDVIKDNFAKTSISSKISLHIGDATQLIGNMRFTPHSIDFAFIDADKRQYLEYYTILLPLMKNHGIIIADNTLWSGKIIDDKAKDAQTIALRKFNDFVHNDLRVSTTILPVRDGMTIIRVL